MRGKDSATDREIVDGINGALDDLERTKALLQGAIVVLDDMQCRIKARDENLAPGPWDDDHPENRRTQKLKGT